MPDDATQNSSTRKSKARWLLALVPLLLLPWFLWQLLGPNPPIIVSKETTYITAPLLPNGLPGYRKYLEDVLRHGVTPEDNAAVPMWQALGPDFANDPIEPDEWQRICNELQLSSSASRKYLIDPDGRAYATVIGEWLYANNAKWKHAAKTPTGLENDTLLDAEGLGYEAVGQAMDAPWHSTDLPPLAEWIAQNNSLIDTLVDGSRRTRLYSPLPLAESDGETTLRDMPLNHIQRLRAIARILVARAMWHLGEGRPDEAWRDLHAIHRWARLTAQGPYIVDQLVAIALDGIASRGDEALLASDNLPLAVARKIHQDLLKLDSPSNIAESCDRGERIYALDSIVSYRQRGIGTFYADNFCWSLETGKIELPFWKIKLLNLVAADWNSSLVKINQLFDQIASAARLPNYQDRQREFERMGSHIYNPQSLPKNISAWLLGAFNRDKRNEMLVSAIVASHSPSFFAVSEAQDTGETRLNLLQLAAALAVYRAENGTYPQQLDELIPSILTQLPTDLYHGKSFVYERDADGYLLYSTGPNGEDDDGSNERMSILSGRASYEMNEIVKEMSKQIPKGADDISIRVPHPPFKLPEPPTTPKVE